MMNIVSKEEISNLIDYYFNMFANKEKKEELEIANDLNISVSELKKLINYVSIVKNFVPSFKNLYNIIMLTTIFKPKTKDFIRQEYVLDNNQDSEIVKVYQNKINA